ncbi:MAG: hypothetical protein Q8J78_17380 [Moraxellaceae bacterium]|nr:hypothetical protein [Moraxellaceae bacterium]
MPHDEAIAAALKYPPTQTLLGRLSTTHLQLCPQNSGKIDTQLASTLRHSHPDIELRLHANVQIEDLPRIVDLCNWPDEKIWFSNVASLSSTLDATAYSAHAGKRSFCSLPEVLCHAREIEQMFGIPVAIEGHYPTPRDVWLISSWAEYQRVLESGVHFALDLSHLHILATCSGRIEWILVKEMLASEKCLEIHVSANDGHSDQHLPLTEPPWWMPLLSGAHPGAIVFSESRQHLSNQSFPRTSHCRDQGLACSSR